MASKGKISYAVEQRLRFIDFLFAQYGTVNRSALMDYFGISMPQASSDLQQYMRLTSDTNAWYDASAKTYRKTDAFVRAYP